MTDMKTDPVRAALAEIIGMIAQRRTDYDACHCTVCQMRDIAEAALATPSPVAPSGAVPDRETFWLAERIGHEQYAKDHSELPALTGDAWRAVRFDTEKQAFDFILRMASSLRDEMRAIEHMFINKPDRKTMPAPIPPARETQGEGLEALVSRFAARLLAKLKLAGANGRSGWERDDWEADCQRGLLRHLEKGDPRDVAAYCAFMDHHGWITKAPPAPHREEIARGEGLREAVALQKRPVAFRAVLPGGVFVLFDDEGVAQRYADSCGVEYQRLYVRDGTASPPTNAPEPK